MEGALHSFKFRFFYIQQRFEKLVDEVQGAMHWEYVISMKAFLGHSLLYNVGI